LKKKTANTKTNNFKKNKVRKSNKYNAGMKIKRHSNHSKKEYFPQLIYSRGLGNSQMKYVKANHSFSKPKHHKTLKNNKRQAKKGVNKKGYSKRNTRYITNSKNNEEKTIKKNKVLNEKKAHKGNLEKSTRVDEENKNRTSGIVKTGICA